MKVVSDNHQGYGISPPPAIVITRPGEYSPSYGDDGFALYIERVSGGYATTVTVTVGRMTRPYEV